MGFIKKFMNVLEIEKINAFEESVVIDKLLDSGYTETKHKLNGRLQRFWGREGEKTEFFSKDNLNRALNNCGFKFDKGTEVWHRGAEGKDALKQCYIEKLEELGYERYCSMGDEFIDEPRMELDDIYFTGQMIEELEKIAGERNLDFSMSLELIILEYLEKRKKADHLDNIVKELEEDNHLEGEIEYIKQHYKENLEFDDMEIYTYLEEYYISYFEKLNFTKEQIDKILKVNDDDVEFLACCYITSVNENKKTFEEIRLHYRKDFVKVGYLTEEEEDRVCEILDKDMR